MTRELIKTDPTVGVQNTPPASPNPNDKTEVEDLVEEEATKKNTEEEPQDEAPTVGDHVAEATEEPKERPVLRNCIREVPAQEIKTSKRKSLNFFLLSTNAVKKMQFWKTKEETVDKDSA